MKCDENYEKWGGYMFFGCQTHLVHDTKWGRWWVLLNFPNFPLSDHGVHLKILQIPPPPLLRVIRSTGSVWLLGHRASHLIVVERQNRIKSDRIMPIQSWGKSGVLVYFGPKIGHSGHIFLRYGRQICFEQ